MTLSAPSGSRIISARAGLAALVLLGLFGWYLRFLGDVRPLSGWLFGKLGLIWGYELLLTTACASIGLAFVEYVCRLQGLPWLEKLGLALPCGLIAFVVGMYIGGFLGWYGATFALLMPLTLFCVGAPIAVPSVLSALSDAQLQRRPSLASLAAVSFGVGCIVILYLGILTPDAVNYDASWNHLVIAQDYAREGRIVPLIGDWVKNVPHLGSIVNTWAFLVPGLDEAPLQWMQALHNEFTVFLWTLVAIAGAVRLIAERASVRGGWAAIFLFPSLFVYDGNMGAAADHYLAGFSVPVLVAGLRMFEVVNWRRALLLGWLAGGALLTKLHAVYLLIPLSALIVARVGWVVVQGRVRREPTELASLVRALAVGALTAIALLCLHFGKNAVFYRNPFYPMAQGKFPSLPTLPDAQLQMDYLFADWHWHPPKLFSDRVPEAVKMVFTFSFKPHYTFNGDLPTFGSMFTLLLPVFLFLRDARRLGLAIVATMGALFVWAMTFWVDRSLQTFMPALAAVTGALIVRGWELGPLLQGPLAALLGLQLVWGADYFFSGNDRINSSIALIRSGIEGHAQDRFAGYRREYRNLGASLPKNARVMLHNNHIMLGIDRPVLLDWVGYQGVFDYRSYASPRQLYDRLVELGVTHVVYVPGSRTAATKQEEVIFDAFAAQNHARTNSFGHLRVFPVAQRPAQLARPLMVMCWRVYNYVDGLYAVEDLSSNEEMPPALQSHPPPRARWPADHDGAESMALLQRADALVSSQPHSLPGAIRDALYPSFERMASHSNVAVYLRKQAGLATGD